MILDVFLFRLNKIWCRTHFLASHAHMCTLIRLTEFGDVRNGMKMKREFVKLFRGKGGEGLAVAFLCLFLK